MVFVAETMEPELESVSVPVEREFLQSHTTLAMSDIVNFDLAPFDQAAKGSYMKGNEGSDFVAVYYALEKNRPARSGENLEIIGDGMVIEWLRSGQNKVSARWGGKNWAPDLTAKIRNAEQRFGHVAYRVVASPANRGGHYSDDIVRKNKSTFCLDR
ncbi:MAG: hypothetical protein L3J68_00205 [Thermoplasmata archaeon]|nr:hypothetical protein [Thermoplasmata archaeon]